MISANDLRKIQIDKVDNGYDINEVNAVIDKAAETIDAYDSESKELYRKMEILASKIEEYREEENSIKAALITAEKISETIKRESKEKADKLIADSEATANKTVLDAQEKADSIIAEAREYSSNLISEKTAEANKLVDDAQTKANDAINSSKIVAQNILDQAKEISDDLVAKSKEEKKAYEILASALKEDSRVFIAKLKALYTEQLDALNSAKLDTGDSQDEQENIDSIQNEIDSLVSEIDEIQEAIPSAVASDSSQDEDDSDEETKIEIEIKTEEEPKPAIDEYEDISSGISVDDIISEIEVASDNADTDDEEEIAPEEPVDPMEAVKAFSTDEYVPVEKSGISISEIDDDAEMEEAPQSEEEKSLFDEGDQLPFESYFNIKREDAHSDRTQTISLVPPEDDDDNQESPKSKKGFFKKKK